MTATERKTPTVQEFKAWAKAHRHLAEGVMAARAFAEMERERVEAYTAPIRREFGFETERGITLDEDSERANAYFAACNAANIAHGWTGNPEHCPALTARSLRLEAERRLVNAGCELMGIDYKLLFGAKWDQMLDLLLGACLKDTP